MKDMVSHPSLEDFKIARLQDDGLCECGQVGQVGRLVSVRSGCGVICMSDE